MYYRGAIGTSRSPTTLILAKPTYPVTVYQLAIYVRTALCSAPTLGCAQDIKFPSTCTRVCIENLKGSRDLIGVACGGGQMDKLVDSPGLFNYMATHLFHWISASEIRRILQVDMHDVSGWHGVSPAVGYIPQMLLILMYPLWFWFLLGVYIKK
ncbi:uncharacterized protein MCYG_00055 [Microsporum canis CBS 113480]|uniref:Uncharacterized protein n=1 Tax=Arthroderma otae (strain ATCC MYA-4605 / CBS 113480) TaxID=554155 RepID=C5FBI3_ARTOC|nr:uncharacterized protein MCYG_00055 [Microsporum canis CBS 113480]EEQ27167.1 predicted protein [Microsporum canis CBS 113480]